MTRFLWSLGTHCMRLVLAAPDPWEPPIAPGEMAICAEGEEPGRILAVAHNTVELLAALIELRARDDYWLVARFADGVYEQARGLRIWETAERHEAFGASVDKIAEAIAAA